MVIRHRKFPVVIECRDPWDNISNLIIKDLLENGWSNYIIPERDNLNQLELFDTLEFQTKDRHGKEMTDYTRMIYRNQR
tara:strand:- start:522 stop:758 length:237 start_codon:yes stop_codon:yes gene_type:complete